MGVNWAALANPAGTPRPWSCIAASRDGQAIIAGVGYSTLAGRLYLSTDGWASRSEAQPAGAVDKHWGTASMSHNGQVILAGVGRNVTAGRLYLSTDGGASWSEVQPAGAVDERWLCSCMSSDGSTIYAAAYSGRVYKSTDSGATWAETQPDGDRDGNWRCMACDATGDVVYIGEYGARAYQTGNGGTAWGEVYASGAATDHNWRDCSVSDDGKYVLFADYQGKVYRSVLYGFTFAAVALTDGLWWSGCQVSHNGQLMIAAAGGTTGTRRVYASQDYGDTWAVTDPTGSAVDRDWRALAVSNARMLVSDGGTIYRGHQVHAVALPDIAIGAPVLTSPAVSRATRNEVIRLSARFCRNVEVQAAFTMDVELEAAITKSIELEADLN